MATSQEQAVALATEFEMHIEDLLDEGYWREIGPDQQEKVATLEDAHGNEVGALLETGDVKDQPNAFYVTLLGGRRFKVSVEHVPDAVPPNSFAATVLSENTTKPAPGTFGPWGPEGRSGL